jgi:uncharacterized repeat protein (TIGR03803 family)
MAVLSHGSAGAASLKTLYAVSGTTVGAASRAGLFYENGLAYGTTTAGGTYDKGTVFSLNLSTGQLRVLHSFKGGADGGSPLASLIDVGGTLYGTTLGAAGSEPSTVFSIDPSSGAEKVLCRLDGNSHAGLVNVGGLLFGTTATGGAGGNGTVFSVDPATGTQSVVYRFAGGQDGTGPDGALLDVGGMLYGTTQAGGTSGIGTVFSLDPATGSETVLHSFSGADGAAPMAALINVGGTLYGTTSKGGTSSNGAASPYGTVFSIDPVTGTEKVLHSFKSNNEHDGAYPAAPLINAGGLLYGTTTGGAFGIDLSTGVETVFTTFDQYLIGRTCTSALISVDGTLYGTTSAGGHATLNGTVFAMNPTTGAAQVVYTFAPPPTASSNALVNVAGTLFLTASAGGESNIGDVVKINPSTGAATELYAFPYNAIGASPIAPLISVGGTMLYGTTSLGGMFGGGIVFSLNPETGAEATVHAFAGQDGSYPAGALLSARGLLYGTTFSGGVHNDGTVFSINPAAVGGGDTVLHSFDYFNEGGEPEAALINVGGRLFGTTSAGATGGGGTVFSVNPVNGAEKTLYSFNETGDGQESLAPLLNVGGQLYGTTFRGYSQNSLGAIFTINPATGAEKVIHSQSDNYEAALIDVGGTLYGTAYLSSSSPGGNSAGSVSSIDPVTGVETEIYRFTDGSDGGYPAAALVRIGNKLYGTTSRGGANGRGTVFELSP